MLLGKSNAGSPSSLLSLGTLNEVTPPKRAFCGAGLVVVVGVMERAGVKKRVKEGLEWRVSWVVVMVVGGTPQQAASKRRRRRRRLTTYEQRILAGHPPPISSCACGCKQGGRRDKRKYK